MDDAMMDDAIIVAPELQVKKTFFQKLFGDIDDLYDEGKITVRGPSFVTHLTSMYWGVRGIPEVLLDTALPVVLFNILDVPSKDGAILQAVIWAPWAMKPFFAILSDLFPMGYHKKRWYMVCVSGLGCAAAYMLWTATPAQLGYKTANTAFIYFFIINVAIAMCDSLTQGKYTEICKWKGSSVVSFVSGSKTSAGTIASFIGPTLNDGGGFLMQWFGRLSAQTNGIIIMPFLAQAAVVQGMNFMGDRPLKDCCSFDKSIWTKDSKIIATGLALGSVALSLTAIQLINNVVEADLSGLMLPWVTGGGIIVLCMTYWSLPFSIAKINTYIILCRVGALDFRYVLQQFYTAPTVQCGSNTPHFPNTIYQMVGLVTANLMTLFGVVLFENYVYYWNARRAFWVTTMFTMAAAFFDLAMITQFNRVLWSWLPVMTNSVTWLCSPDEEGAPGEFTNCEPAGYRLDDLFGFLMGSQGIKYIATTLDDMPSTILLSKLCPAGVETTVFAMLAALMNLGLTFSGLLAGKFLEIYGVNIDKTEVNQTFYNESVGENQTRLVNEYICDLGLSHWEGLQGLPWGIILGGVILPGLTIPATFIFIPNINLSDKFVDQTAVETEMNEAGTADVSNHPAANFARSSPSFDPLTNPQLAPAEELERSSYLSFERRGGALSTSRLL